MMSRFRLAVLAVFLVGGVMALEAHEAAGQELPRATQLPGRPFFVKKNWVIGGEGNWDYLTLDPDAMQLFVAHGTSVQLVDVNAGTLAGKVDGLRDAHGIALDDTGQQGFISDGGANQVRIFDRHSLAITASAPTGPNPRAIVYEPTTKLVFAICTEPASDAILAQLAKQEAESRAQRTAQGANPAGANADSGAGNVAGSNAANTNARAANTASQNPANQSPAGAGTTAARRQQSGAQGRPQSGASAGDEITSVVSVIDSSNGKTLGHLLLTGHLGYAITDNHGEIYINVVDRNRIVHFHAQSAMSALQQQAALNSDESEAVVDWSRSRRRDGTESESDVSVLRLGTDCHAPKGLAIDGDQNRIFAACDNQKLQVLNSGTGEVVTTLTIGQGTDAIGYDAARGLIYTANGGGVGSVTVIRRDVADTYEVIQELPTKQRARTMAVNSTNGEVYLVTNLEGYDLSKPGTGGGPYTLPVTQATPVHGSFQVLVVGN